MKSFAVLREDLRQWFDPKHPKGGWKRINSKGEAIGPCARKEGEGKPKCMSNQKRAQLSKKERAAAVAAKRKHDPNPDRKGAPINVSNFGKGKIGENVANLPEKTEEVEQLDEKNVPTSPEKWARAKAQAKAKFDVYPSAYANGWAAKKYKAMGGGWKSVSEAVKDKFDVGEYDQEGDMVKSDLRSIMANAKRLHDMIEDADNLPEWCQNKITLAEDYVSTVANYLTAEMNETVESGHGDPSKKFDPRLVRKVNQYSRGDWGPRQGLRTKKPMKKKMKEEAQKIEERSLTEPEMKKKEEIVKSMKKKLMSFKDRYGDRAKEVMYATATKMAKKD